LGNEGIYENYIRVFVPQSSTFSSVVLAGPNSEEKYTPDEEEIRGRKEAGVFVEIGASQKRSIVYTWETPVTLSFSESGQYSLVWRKQAGTVSDSVQVLISGDKMPPAVSLPQASLTEGGTYGYNTKLAEDFAPRIFW
jgi:hypothetical protein